MEEGVATVDQSRLVLAIGVLVRVLIVGVPVLRVFVDVDGVGERLLARLLQPVAEDLEEDTVVAMSYWQSEAGFDDHLRWRIGTSRWTEMEQKYLEGEPEYKVMPVMFRFRDHS